MWPSGSDAAAAAAAHTVAGGAATPAGEPGQRRGGVSSSSAYHRRPRRPGRGPGSGAEWDLEEQRVAQPEQPVCGSAMSGCSAAGLHRDPERGPRPCFHPGGEGRAPVTTMWSRQQAREGGHQRSCPNLCHLRAIPGHPSGQTSSTVRRRRRRRGRASGRLAGAARRPPTPSSAHPGRHPRRTPGRLAVSSRANDPPARQSAPPPKHPRGQRWQPHPRCCPQQLDRRAPRRGRSPAQVRVLPEDRLVQSRAGALHKVAVAPGRPTGRAAWSRCVGRQPRTGGRLGRRRATSQSARAWWVMPTAAPRSQARRGPRATAPRFVLHDDRATLVRQAA